MMPKASASSAVAGIFSDWRISALEVRRNGLHDFSLFSVVGIWDIKKNSNKYDLRRFTYNRFWKSKANTNAIISTEQCYQLGSIRFKNWQYAEELPIVAKSSYKQFRLSWLRFFSLFLLRFLGGGLYLASNMFYNH